MNLSRNDLQECGIVTVRLIDPISCLISKIIGGNMCFNAVGFYYDINTIILFNVYTGDYVPWMRFGYDLDSLLSCPFVDKIIFYPIDSTQTISKNMVQNKSRKLGELFRFKVLTQIENIDTKFNQKINYKHLLLKAVGITQPNTTSNGYTLINNILLSLMSIKSPSKFDIASDIIPCHLLKPSINLSSSDLVTSSNDTKRIFEESRHEMIIISNVFIDLFFTHDTFRQHIFNTQISTQNAIKNNIPHINQTFSTTEKDPIHHKSTNIQQLNTSKKDSNISINIQQLTPYKKDFEQSNTFEEDSKQLNKYKEDSNSTQIFSSSINKGGSNMSQCKGIQPLNNIISENYGRSVGVNSKSIISQTNSQTETKNNNDISKRNLEKHHIELSELSVHQLLDILIYIDSLRDSDGITSTKYATLQNTVIQELAKRQKKY